MQVISALGARMALDRDRMGFKPGYPAYAGWGNVAGSLEGGEMDIMGGRGPCCQHHSGMQLCYNNL